MTVTNDYYQSYTGLMVTVDVLNFDLTNKYHNVVTLTAGPASSNVALTIPTLSGLTTTYFVKLKLQDSTGKVLSDNFYWYSTSLDTLSSHCKWYYCGDKNYANLTSLQTLPMVTLTHMDSFGTDTAATTLTNSSTSLAFLIRLRVTNAGNDVLPAFWTDNYITLLPGESRSETVTFPTGTLPPGSIVQVDGFNVNPD